jgi:hypothetical protein
MDNYNGEELGKLIKRFDIRNPEGNNEVLPPMAFNLTFKTSIGPSSGSMGYLRPEIARATSLTSNSCSNSIKTPCHFLQLLLEKHTAMRPLLGRVSCEAESFLWLKWSIPWIPKAAKDTRNLMKWRI